MGHQDQRPHLVPWEFWLSNHQAAGWFLGQVHGNRSGFRSCAPASAAQCLWHCPLGWPLIPCELFLFWQVIFEGEIGKGNLGGIAVDDISINNHISQEDCASKYGQPWTLPGMCPGDKNML